MHSTEFLQKANKLIAKLLTVLDKEIPLLLDDPEYIPYTHAGVCDLLGCSALDIALACNKDAKEMMEEWPLFNTDNNSSPVYPIPGGPPVFYNLQEAKSKWWYPLWQGEQRQYRISLMQFYREQLMEASKKYQEQEN